MKFQWGDALSIENKNREQILFHEVWIRQVYNTLIKRWIFVDSDEIEFLSQRLGIFLVAFALKLVVHEEKTWNYST